MPLLENKLKELRFFLYGVPSSTVLQFLFKPDSIVSSISAILVGFFMK